MKKIFTLAALAVVLAGSATAQTHNLFAPWAVDADGWLWFDRQDKIDAYVGSIDNNTGIADAAGKIIQMAEANHGSYEATTASPTVIGVGGTGSSAAVGGPGALTGAIVLAPASKQGGSNGGGIVLKVPSLATLSIKMSSTENKYIVVCATKNATLTTDAYEMVFNTFNFPPFKKLSGAGIYEWNGVETLSNIAGNTIVSSDAIYVFVQNSNKAPLYIHGIKVMTPKQETVGIDEVTTTTAATTTDVYTADGVLVKRGATAGEVKAQGKGLYIVRSGKEVKKIVVE